MTSPYTDRTRLVEDAYTDDSKLSARQSIYQFRRPGPDFHGRMIGLLDLSQVHRVVDVGCGNAIYLDRLVSRLPEGATVVGVDLSQGMLRNARHRSGRVVADAQALPIASGSVDVLLALHMLYHVPDPLRAVREFRRVLRPGGLAVVSTNGERHLRELIALGDGRVLRGTRLLGLQAAAELLGGVFDSVERHDFDDELVVTDPDPLVEYVRSTVSLGGDPDSVAALERRVRSVVAEQPFIVSIHPGVLIAR